MTLPLRPASGEGPPHLPALGLPALYAACVLAYGGLAPATVWAWITLAAAGTAVVVGAIGRIVHPEPAGGAPHLERGSGAARLFALAVGGALVLIVAAGQLNRASLWLSPLPAALWVASGQARSRGGPGWVPALAQAMGPVAGWVAVRGTVEGPAWLLAAATALWLGRGVDVRSPGTRLAHAGAVALWVMTGWACGRVGWYFGGIALAAALLAWYHADAARPAGDPAASRRVLIVHAAVGLSVLAGSLLDVVTAP